MQHGFMFNVFFIGSTAEVVADGESNLLGLFYQDSSMKCAYEAFPEMIFVDATHKLNESRMPLFQQLFTNIESC